MEKPILIQKQMRDNANDLHNFVRDLKLWEEEMKRKDRQLNNQNNEEALPPVRRAKLSTNPSSKNQAVEKNNKRIRSYDYKSWDTFDVEKACEDVDNEHKDNVILDEESAEENEKYLKEKALYEKELGNQHVKASRWNAAIEAYTRAINAYPKDPIFYANRALCYLKNKRWEKVETDCTEALKLDSTYVKAYLRRAVAREALGRLEDTKHDFRQVLLLEPNNSQAMQSLKKLEEKKKVDCKESLTKQPTSLNVENQKVSQSSTSQPIAKAEKISLIQAVSTSESNLTLEPSSEPNWEPSSSTIQPISKPPHLRSKKSFKHIEIHDIGLNAPKHVCATKSLCLPKDQEVSIDSKLLTQASSETNPKSIFTLTGTKEIPPPPKTSVQFHKSWSCIKDDSHLCYKFLKQIPGEALAEIFKESLESQMLSRILETLASECNSEEGQPLLPYLRGLTTVKRFTTLALFLSPRDKTNLVKLFEHCISQGECSPSDIESLRSEYEM